MTKRIPEYLKLHVAEPAPEPTASDELSSVEMLCCAFERATGWQLRYEHSANASRGGGMTASDNGAGLVLSPAQRADDERYPRLPRQAVEHLATALAIVLGEFEQTKQALADREAELAAGVPVTARRDEQSHLSERLTCGLQTATEGVGAQAAALYLLDEATSQLKLRASFGLPSSRLLAPPRPLRGAIADLEALLGHAVVIEDTALLPHWQTPEDFPAAMCVPISSPTMPLGTLWIFSTTPRDFSPSQTNLVEIVAGKIASDLEREMLLTTGARTETQAREIEEAAQWQAEHLPTVAPLIDDWDVAGATQSANPLASEFYDWSVLPDGQLAVAVGDAHARSLTAGLSSAALQATVKSHASYTHSTKQLLTRVNDTLWTSSSGGHYASLCYGQIAPEEGRLELASAGKVSALLVDANGHELLTRGTAPLGSDPELIIPAREQLILPGSALVLLSDGVLASLNAEGQPWNEAMIAELLGRHLHLSADELIARLRTALGVSAQFDRTFLVVKRLR